LIILDQKSKLINLKKSGINTALLLLVSEVKNDFCRGDAPVLALIPGYRLIVKHSSLSPR
jgi:hypothetical protein